MTTRIFTLLPVVLVLGSIGACPSDRTSPAPSPRAGAWKSTVSGMLETTIDAAPQPSQDWTPGVSVRFDADGNLLALSSLAPDPYYRVTDGTRQAMLQSVGDMDVSCVYSRLASGYERVELTSLDFDNNSVWIEFESEFSGHTGSTSLSNGRATQTIELHQQTDGLLCTVTYSSEYDLRELEGPDGDFVTRHYTETFTAQATLTPTDETELVPYEDSCPD